MTIPLSELNQLTGACNPDECVRNLRRIIHDPFPEIDRVSVVRDESFDPRQSPDSPFSEFLRQVVSNGSESVERQSDSPPEIDEPAWAEFLAGLARARDATLRSYDLQRLRPCIVRGQRIGWLLFWRREGAPPISKRTRDLIDARMPFASFLMTDLAKTATPRRVAAPIFATAVGRIVVEGHLGDKEAEVVVRLMRGCTYSEISSQMRISVNTVRKHIRNIYNKLDVHTALGIVNRYLIDPLLREAEGEEGLDRDIIMYA